MDKLTSLDEYLDRMKEGQKQIYYLAGTSTFTDGQVVRAWKEGQKQIYYLAGVFCAWVGKVWPTWTHAHSSALGGCRALEDKHASYRHADVL